MKIRISTLLLTVEIFLNFVEFSTQSDPPEGQRPPSLRRRNQLSLGQVRVSDEQTVYDSPRVSRHLKLPVRRQDQPSSSNPSQAVDQSTLEFSTQSDPPEGQRPPSLRRRNQLSLGEVRVSDEQTVYDSPRVSRHLKLPVRRQDQPSSSNPSQAVDQSMLEFNAADYTASSTGSPDKRGGPRPGGGRPRGSLTRRQDGMYQGQFSMYYKKNRAQAAAYKAAFERPRDGLIEHRETIIEVWRDPHQGIVRTEYPNNDCPVGVNYGRFDYLLRLVILPDEERIVECRDEHGNLLGVKPWMATTGNYMEPTPTQWFIIHAFRVFRVREDPTTHAAIRITLATSNENEVAQGRRAETVNMNGFRFGVLRLGDTGREITGAVLL